MRLKVVVIENDEATLRILNEQMDWASLDCELAGQAADGEAGRQLILEKKPDIILSGIHISKMDGLDMLESIRPALPESKIILITKHARFPYALRAIKLGACDYLLKPVTAEDVQQSVRRGGAQAGGHPQAPGPAAGPADQRFPAGPGRERNAGGRAPGL